MRETNRISHHRPIAILLSILPALALAQADAPAASPAAKNKEDVLVLSPFVVQSGEGESGYASDLTTSGSRLKTSLKDVAASVSVLTNDFMNDLAATDVASAMALVSGAETDKTFHNESVLALGGPNGYVGGDFGDNNNRSGYIRVRGLGKATTTQDFIEVIGSTDRYNTDRTEFLRGANSILFGLAEPAGLVNSSRKVANLRRNTTSLESKLDNNGSTRWVLDHSQVLLRNKLALRLIGLDTDQRFEVETARSKDQRLYLTGAFRPFKNTTLTASYERQNTWGRRPNYRTVQDNVSEWLRSYNTYATQMTPAQIDAAFFWDPALTTQRGLTATSSVFTLANGSTVDLGVIRRPLDTRPNGTTLIYNGNGQWTNPLDNLVTLMANRTVTGGNATPASSQQQFMRSGSARENDPTYLADPQVTDEGIFPYSSVELAALPGAYRSERDTKYFVNLDQRITDNLYFSASFQHEKWKQEQYFPILTQTNQISLDITKTLPDGRVNPNFLRPFVYGRNIGEYNDKQLDSVVVQANYDFDFAKKTSRLGWLGFHRFTTVYTHSKQAAEGHRWNYQWDNDVPVGLTAANYGQGNNPNRWIMQMWYVGDKVQLGDTALRFTGFPSTTNAQWDRSYDLRFFNSTAVPAAWQTATSQVHAGRQVLPGLGINSWQVNEGIGTSLQSYFLNRRLVTLVGWRHDAVESFQGIPLAPTLAMFPTVPGASKADFTTGNSYRDSANTTTQSAVFKLSENLRVFATRSENFAATAPRQDNLYRTLAAPNGQTTDFGLGLTILDGRLDLRYTHFSSAQKNATSNTGVATIRILAFETSLYNALLAGNRLAEWSTVSPTGGTTTQQYVNPSNGASTMDLESKGDSIEVNYRPNKHWDFAGSIDRLENVSTRVGTEVMDFLDVRAPFYKKYFDEGLRADGTTSATSTSTLLSTTFATGIASNYVNELVARGTSNRGISEYTAKLVARYKFLGGKLNGLTLGANARWESGKIIGYGQQSATFNLGGLQNYSGLVYNPAVQYKGPKIIAGGLMASYQRKIYRGKINWRVQLNAQNLFDKTGLVVFAANPNGSPIYAYNPGRVYELTNTFSF